MNHYVIDESFVNENLAGAQRKGVAKIDGREMFVKLDERIDGEATSYGSKYSSVHDAVTSIVIRNIQNLTFESLDYELATFEICGRIVSGTISDVFSRDKFEIALAREKDSGYLDSQMLMTIDDYNDSLSTNPKDLLEKRLPEHVIRQLKQQSLLDILTNNRDRKHNPGNVGFLVDENGEGVELFNFDYGQCFNPKDFWMTDDPDLIDFYAQNMHSQFVSPDSLFSYNELVDVEPLEINVDRLKQDLDDFVEKVNSMGVPFSNYAQIVAKAALRQIETSNRILVDVSLRNAVQELSENEQLIQ